MLAVDDEIVAVLPRLPLKPAPTLTVSVKLAEAPLANVAHVIVTVPVPPTAGVVIVAAGPVFCASETNVTPAGNVSVNTALSAAAGPALLALIV